MLQWTLGERAASSLYCNAYLSERPDVLLGAGGGFSHKKAGNQGAYAFVQC